MANKKFRASFILSVHNPLTPATTKVVIEWQASNVLGGKLPPYQLVDLDAKYGFSYKCCNIGQGNRYCSAISLRIINVPQFIIRDGELILYLKNERPLNRGPEYVIFDHHTEVAPIIECILEFQGAIKAVCKQSVIPSNFKFRNDLRYIVI